MDNKQTEGLSLDWPWLAFQMEGAISQGEQVIPRSWKGKECSLPRASRVNTALPTP